MDRALIAILTYIYMVSMPICSDLSEEISI